MSQDGFQRALDQIRSIDIGQADKGRLFERLMATFFKEDPVYRERFSGVWLWKDWVDKRLAKAVKHCSSRRYVPPPQFGLDRADLGIDLVAEEADGSGWCAIQCKCYAPGTRLSKRHLDSFISASAREPFTARIVVDTGDSWGPNALKTLKGLKPACAVLRFGDLADRRFEWPDLSAHRPEDLRYAGAPFTLRPHQEEALDDVMAGFEASDRGKLVMACGTGKTFTALRIAEAVAGPGGRALYLVPSISLFAQSMREWATQKSIPHGYIGICSDTSAGRYREDATLMELEIPVTTSPVRISEELRKERPEQMTVVFCTYQSLPLVERAQQEGAPPFDLILCDEAHRTTGVERPDDKKTSPFVLVHDNARIRGRKRLYMTATPRIYTDRSKRKAAKHSIDVFSMDEKEIYGPEFHRLSFSRAIERELLSDYKVVILALAEDRANAVLRKHVSVSEASELNITDAAKIMGCWRALQRRQAAGGNGKADDESERPLTRAIAFANTIKASRLLEKHWDGVVEQAISMLPPEERAIALRCSTKHVDGKTRALDRKARIEWLKGKEDGVCRILSNARCLSEGVDVPALDAVFFTAPRRSPVEIVQAVGRVMRKTPDKDYGYIVLPVAIPPGVSPEKALNDNKRFESVWEVLRALRSHDDRFDAEVNRLDLKRPERIIIDIDDSDQWEIAFPPLDLPPEAIFAKIVEKCGDRKYWKTWASDIADIFARLVERIGSLLADPANEALKEWFDGFHQELRESINESVSESDAVDMVAQHILTRPVFDALFEGYDFARGNPVARALEQLRQDFGEFGLENELRDMEPFYESVRLRARGLDDSAARQQVLKELYEHFFKIALSKAAERLGIVYTPVEVVDFILRSADHVLREEFGKGLTDEGVHVLDPFTGTGLFPARMLQLDLVDDADVARKYQEEIHANEIVLLAYYIAAVNVEEAFHARRGPGVEYKPFEGIVLTDTFHLNERQTSVFLSENSERSRRQEQARIEVIVGNPPWSGGQRSSADDNPNLRYPALEARIAETYAVRSTATLKRGLYDMYKMSIRWASDRIGDQGMVAFVTNGSWIDGNVDQGVRACLAEEFTSIHVVSLRGNARTSGDRRRREGDNIFGQGSRAPVAITLLVRNPEKRKDGCRIMYHDIGDYLKQKTKLNILRRAKSIKGIASANPKPGWRQITPDKHNDWVNQRAPGFEQCYPIGTKGVKAGNGNDAVFRLFSNGYKTSRDAHTYNFSRSSCDANARAMVREYCGAMALYHAQHSARPLDSVVAQHSVNLRWDVNLRNNLRRKKKTTYSDHKLRKTQYRPFVRSWCYVDYIMANSKYQQDRIFPSNTRLSRHKDVLAKSGDDGMALGRRSNLAICVPGIGSTKPFFTLIVDRMPDLGLGQCFPRYRYEEAPRKALFDEPLGLQRIDNITDAALLRFRAEYQDEDIQKDDIFNYVYGILHSPRYRDRFKNDLSKGLPRIPFAPDFDAFAGAGSALSELHLRYDDENLTRYPLKVASSTGRDLEAGDFRLGKRRMRFADKTKRDTLIVNDQVRLSGIPEEAHRYAVGGRTPLEWFIFYFFVKTDRRSGIVNDANGWFEDPQDLVPAIERLVYVSVETAGIVDSLPDPFGDVRGASPREVRDIEV